MLNEQRAADLLERLDQFVPHERVDILRLQLLDLSGYRHDVHADRGEDALHLRDLVLVAGHESNLQVSPSMNEKRLATSYCCCMSQMDSPSAMAAPWSSAKPR